MIVFNNCEIGHNSVLVRIPELNLKAGNIYALIGANGSGKSTLLNTIINKKSLLGGELFIDSKSHATFSAKELAQKIAYVESKFDGVEYLTVEEYISLGRTPYTDAFGRFGEKDNQAISKAFLDYGNRIKLIQLLSKIALEEQKCIVFSSHDIDLCLDSNIQMLIVNQQNKTMELCASAISKKEVLAIGFGIK